MTRLPRPDAGARDAGFTLIELVVVMALSIILLLAVLQSLDVFSAGSARQSRIIDAGDQTRRLMDGTVRDLRNGSTVLRAGANDLEYAVAVSPGGTRYVRLCLTAASVLRSEQSTTNPSPGSACPSTATGWSSANVVTLASANTAANPLFRYDSSTPAAVRSVGLTFSLDATTGGRAAGSTLRASAFLRSQAERAPVVTDGDIKATCTPSGPLLDFSLLTNLINGPVSVVANGLVPSGSTLQLTNGVSSLTATVTNALGLTTTITKDIACN